MKILITGVSGTGKSTTCRALNKSGIFSIDFSDIPGLCFWCDKKTLAKVEYPANLSAEWFDKHTRWCDIAKLKAYIDQHEDIVITGVASGNEEEYYKLFDKVILLECDPKTFTHRMQTRGVPWGETVAAQNQVIDWSKSFNSKLKSRGAISINTEGEFGLVFAKILAALS